MTRFAAPIAEAIWDMKYRLKTADGTPVDDTVEDTWRRVARSTAAAEADPATWEDRFYAALEDFRFLPAGGIMGGAGSGVGSVDPVSVVAGFPDEILLQAAVPDGPGLVHEMVKIDLEERTFEIALPVEEKRHRLRVLRVERKVVA